MKQAIKLLLILLGITLFSQTVMAQHNRYERRYRPVYAYRPYVNYAPVRANLSVVARLPFGAVALTLGNRHYHYWDGLYYHPYPGGYAIVQPPIGLVVPVLPPSAVSIVIGGRSYYRYQSVFYLPLGGNGYRVVETPKETETTKAETKETEAASGYEKFVLEGKTYYKKGGKYYKAKLADNGEILYEEVGETTQ